MPMTETQIDLVRRSFAILREHRAEHAAFGQAFYDRLFRLMPEARDLFRDDLEAQGMRFLSTLAVIVDALDRPEALEEPLAKLGQGHAAYGVRPEHFGPMGEALIGALKEDLETRIDAETEAAWRAAYADVAERMSAAMAG